MDRYVAVDLPPARASLRCITEAARVKLPPGGVSPDAVTVVFPLRRRLGHRNVLLIRTGGDS